VKLGRTGRIGLLQLRTQRCYGNRINDVSEAMRIVSGVTYMAD